MGEEYHEQGVVQQLFLKIFTPLGVIVLDSPARATPGPHPMGGGQLPDSVGHQLNKPKKKPTIYLEEWNCPRSCQGRTFQNVDLSCRSLLPHTM
jgi:hypothetical protein